MDSLLLLKRVESVFPYVEMPAHENLPFHKSNCRACGYFANDVEEYRGREVSSEFVRSIHQELPCASALATLWILPIYLRYCLTEGQYSSTEVDYFIDGLRPEEKFKADTLERLSLLNSEQLKCIKEVLEWTLEFRMPRDGCVTDIEQAIDFVSFLCEK